MNLVEAFQMLKQGCKNAKRGGYKKRFTRYKDVGNRMGAGIFYLLYDGPSQ